jgi:hypothetical protein
MPPARAREQHELDTPHVIPPCDATRTRESYGSEGMPAFRMCDVMVTLGKRRDMARAAHMSYSIGSPNRRASHAPAPYEPS